MSKKYTVNTSSADQQLSLNPEKGDVLVDVRHLKEYFNISTGLFASKPLKAVDDVSFTIRKGETLGLVGESGCGKTTVGRTILHLYKPTAGEVWFKVSFPIAGIPY